MLIVNTQVKETAVIISINGNLNIDNTFDVEKEFNEYVSETVEVVAFDCKELSSLDSSGLGLFVKFLKEAKTNDFELVFFNITDNILSLFDISKLDNFFTIMSESEFNKVYL